MKFLQKNRFVIPIIIILSYIVVTALILRGLSINEHNLWMDFSGNFDLKTYLAKDFFAWNSNMLGVFQFSVFANLTFHLYIKLIYSVFGLSHGTYMIFFVLVFSALLSGRYLANSMIKDKFYSYLISFIFVFNPLFLYYLFGTGTISFLMAFIGFYLALAFMFNFFKTNNKFYILGLVLCSFLVSHPFLFPFYCLTVCFLLFFFNKKKAVIGFLTSILLVNSYWIIPFFTSFIFKGPRLLGSYTDNLINIFSANGLYQYSFLFMGRSYTFLKEMYGSGQVLIYLILFILWGAGIHFSLVVKRKKEYAYFWLFILFLLIFSIGPRLPFGIVFKILYTKFSFFSYFRSYQNIFIIMLPILLFFLLLISRSNDKLKKILAVSSVLLAVLFFIIGNRQIINRSANIPKEYFEVQKIVSEDKTSNRVMLMPLSKYDYYSWDKPWQDKYFFEALFPYNGLTFFRPTIDNEKLKSTYDKLYNDPNFDYQELTNLGVKYILLRKDLLHSGDGYFDPFNGTISPTQTTKIYSTNNLELYKINSSAPFISASNIVFQKITPIKYSMTIKNISSDTAVNFKEYFNDGWQIYPEKNKLNNCQVIGNYQNNASECISKNSGLNLLDIKYFFKKPVPSSNHELYDQYGNSWHISKESISQLPKGSYTVNSDGTVDVQLVLYFKPQVYFYLATIISLLSLIALGIFSFSIFKNGKKQQ